MARQARESSIQARASKASQARGERSSGRPDDLRAEAPRSDIFFFDNLLNASIGSETNPGTARSDLVLALLGLSSIGAAKECTARWITIWTWINRSGKFHHWMIDLTGTRIDRSS
jgi:hypothetical protein